MNIPRVESRFKDLLRFFDDGNLQKKESRGGSVFSRPATRHFDLHAKLESRRDLAPPSLFSPARSFVKFWLDRYNAQFAVAFINMDCGTGTVFCSLKDNERFYRSVYACVGFPLITRFTYFSFFFRGSKRTRYSLCSSYARGTWLLFTRVVI